MAELAGLALGAFPIVLEALKGFEKLYKFCKRFKKCKSGVEELLRCLEVQKVIFRNETELLLKSALGSTDARLMIDDLAHPLWQDRLCQARIDRLLGDSKAAIEISVQDLTDLFTRFEEELDKLRIEDSHHPRPDRSQRKEFRKRFKYAFSGSNRLQDLEDVITEKTTRYLTLRSQLREKAAHEPEPVSDSQAVQKILDQVSATQAASRKIYEILTAACSLHTTHHAHFGLQPMYTTAGPATEIKFQIAYRHLPRKQVQSSQDMPWLVVESVLYGTLTRLLPSVSRDDASMTMKRTRSPSPVAASSNQHQSEQIKRVRFRSRSPDLKDKDQKKSCMSTIPLPLALPDLGSRGDLCTQIRARCSKHPRETSSCIGLLGKSSHWLHRVYHGTISNELVVSKQAGTLLDLLKTASQTSWNVGIPLSQRLRIASLLASAILNFHSTPWMHCAWGSRDIFLYKSHTSPVSLRSGLLQAYVDVPIGKDCSGTMIQEPHILAPHVRNHVLYSLAVILLELAFEKPVQDLIDPCDRNRGYATPEFHAVTRLTIAVSARLGQRYAKIVEQCLFCAFGEGTELENPLLQGAIQRDVVLELDRLAKNFESLCMT